MPPASTARPTCQNSTPALSSRADRADPVDANPAAPAFGKRKAALYATCFVNYNKPVTGMAARAVLNHIGVETKAAYPGCCGMPFLEQAELSRVAANAAKVSKELVKLIDEGYDIVALTASCGLMLKFEWALICPGQCGREAGGRATSSTSTNMWWTSRKKEGLPHGLTPLPEGVTVHLACHARAQNMGPKAAEMLKMIPETPVDVIERCSGHGGTFGVVKPTHDVAVKVGRPVFRAAEHAGTRPYRLGLPAGGAAYLSITPRHRRASRNIPSRSWRAPMGWERFVINERNGFAALPLAKDRFERRNAASLGERPESQKE